ncbi:tetratricopeptide repeat protein [Luteibacter sp.]|uniref:tetratricopeptide repeat protein n=1 Tax=Luteibacter sp. TaxID=1886636 RepID=UPI002F412DC4
MTFAFYLIAGAMLVLALALLLVPLVRQGRRHGRSRAIFALIVAIAVLVPLGSAGMYWLVGTPSTLGGVEPARDMTVGEAIDQLLARLKEHPDDAQAWVLLGKTYAMLKQPADARSAYDHAMKADPKNVAAMVGWAESDSLVRPDHRIAGRGFDLLQGALAIEPDSQRALWLLGIAQFQQDRYTDAAATWRKLQPLLDPDSNVAHAVSEQIAIAEKRAGAGQPDAARGNIGGNR